MVTWDSDASSSDDDKTTKKKALASIAINEKPSLFDTPSCFMAKATKVQTCDDGMMRNMIMKVTTMMNPLKMN